MGVADGRSGKKKPPNESNDSLGVAKRGRDEVGGWRDKGRGKRPPNESNQLIGGCRMQEGRKNTQQVGGLVGCCIMWLGRGGGAWVGGEKDHPTSQIDSLGVIECRRVVKNTQRVVGLVGCCVTWLGRGGARGAWPRRGGRVEGQGEGKKTTQRVKSTRWGS